MSVATLREVRLYGQLGREFGRVHHLAIQTPHEAVRALSATVAGFKEFLLGESTLGYKVIVGRVAKTLEEIHQPSGAEVIKIVPVVGGAKKGGVRLILLGAALLFGGPLVGGLIANTQIGGTIALYGAKIGTALILGGVVALVSPQRKPPAGGARPENLPNYAFDGPVNTTQQGLPVPLGYGRCIVGSAVVSAGLSVDDTSPPAPTPAPAPPPLPPDQQWDWSNYGNP